MVICVFLVLRPRLAQLQIQEFLELVISSSRNLWIWSCGQIEGISLSHLALILD
uniref:Uncharacterized protein n=1 Tax=Arundo donax TaxID=35708 RepID=A0A0A9EGX0_ARUDO